MHDFTPDHITQLAPNEIFTFGSNRAGRHGAGAARTALKWGAVYGHGEGLMGQTYALPTKDERLRTLALGEISIHIGRYLKCAEQHPDLVFLTTEVGCGLAALIPAEVAPLFYAFPIPANVVLPRSFAQFAPNAS